MARTRLRGEDTRIVDETDIDVDFSEVELQKGRYFRAVCLSGDAVGECVFVSVLGTPPTVAKADPSDETKMPAAGIIFHKFAATDCLVVNAGEFVTTGLTRSTYYVGPLAIPVDSKTGLTITQRVGIALDTTRLLLDFDPEGGDLSKILLTVAGTLVYIGDGDILEKA